MKLSDFFLGYCEIRINSVECRRFFNICSYHNLFLWNITADSVEENQCSYHFFVRNSEYDQIKDIGKKTNVEIELLRKKGFPVFAEYIKHHSWFVAGAVMALFLLWGCSRRIWDIQIDGNKFYDKDTFIRQLKAKNIYAGIQADQIDCSGLSAYIREKYDKVTWASAELNGCKLVIRVKEDYRIKENTSLSKRQAYDLIAEKDGVVQKILVRQGISQVEAGQQIKKGDVLISGWIPIYDDSGVIVENNPICADGDVMLLSDYAYYHEIPRKWYENTIVAEYKEPIIQLGNYNCQGVFFSFVRNKKKDISCDFSCQLKSTKQIHLTQSFDLPIKMGYSKQIFYKKKPKYYSDEQLKTLSESEFYYFCSNLEKKGVQIYENDVKMYMSDASCVMSGNISVIEQTGVLRKAESLQDGGK